jgi:hypothetical protein
MHNPPLYQAFGYFLMSFMKDVKGNFFAMYEKQLIKIQLPFKVLQKLETH